MNKNETEPQASGPRIEPQAPRAEHLPPDGGNVEVTRPPEAMSPWVEYVTSRKGSPKAFLRKIGKGGRVTVPDLAAVRAFSEAVTERPERVARVLALLQAATTSTQATHDVVIELAQAAAARELQLDRWPADASPASLGSVIEDWIRSRPKTPLAPRDLQFLHVLLLLAHTKHGLEQDEVFRLTRAAVTRPQKTPSTKGAKKRPFATTDERRLPANVLLGVTPGARTLSILVDFYEAVQQERNAQVGRISELVQSVEDLQRDLAEERATEAGLRDEIATLVADRAAALEQVAELEVRLSQMDDGYKHKLLEVRGRMRGILEGQLTRWLQTALQASQETPPWTHTIQERLEEALALIEKESKWLHPSA